MPKNSVTACQLCPRLRSHCEEVAQVKRRAYLDDMYWGKPVEGFGDPNAHLVVIGLAPGAHGANRTGRVLTGDRSGDWLYRALHKAGFANQPHSLHRNDGLVLKNAYVTCVVKCAPPDNKPNPREIENCSHHLKRELEELPHTRVWIALGQLAFKGLWNYLRQNYFKNPREPFPKFEHGGKIQLDKDHLILMSYHPSQQNTFTGRLTEPMFDSVFNQARDFCNC